MSAPVEAPKKERKVPMVARTLRVPRDLWDAAATAAAAEDPPRAVSDVVRDGLAAYVEGRR